MKYYVRKSIIQVLGVLWLPPVDASEVLTLSDYDLANMRDDSGQITRDSIALWLTSHSGNFSRVLDFAASIEDGDTSIEIPFTSTEMEDRYTDTLGEDY